MSRAKWLLAVLAFLLVAVGLCVYWDRAYVRAVSRLERRARSAKEQCDYLDLYHLYGDARRTENVLMAGTALALRIGATDPQSQALLEQWDAESKRKKQAFQDAEQAYRRAVAKATEAEREFEAIWKPPWRPRSYALYKNSFSNLAQALGQVPLTLSFLPPRMFVPGYDALRYMTEDIAPYALAQIDVISVEQNLSLARTVLYRPVWEFFPPARERRAIEAWLQYKVESDFDKRQRRIDEWRQKERERRLQRESKR